MTIRRRSLFPALAVGFAMLPACSSTRIESAIPPGAVVREHHRLLVVPMIGDPAREAAAEEAYARAFAGRPEELLRSSEALPAGLDESEFYELMAKHGVDGVLVLRLGGAGAVAAPVGDYHAGKDMEYHRNSCDAKLLTRMYTKPGDELNEAELAQPWLDMTVTLVDVVSRKAAWSARIRTQGTQGTPFARLARTQASEVIARLAKDGMLRGR